jgi:ABC-type antimicrobial peptide transport system permease subunit
MALGATPLQVLKTMTRQTGKLILAGIACGVLLSLVLARLMSHVLLGFVQLDARVWFDLTSILLITAFLAAYLPATRATKVDPLIALRHD